jgi:hypothetical protein
MISNFHDVDWRGRGRGRGDVKLDCDLQIHGILIAKGVPNPSYGLFRVGNQGFVKIYFFGGVAESLTVGKIPDRFC